MSNSWFIWVCQCPQKVHDDPEYDGSVECSRCKGEVEEIEVVPSIKPSTHRDLWPDEGD